VVAICLYGESNLGVGEVHDGNESPTVFDLILADRCREPDALDHPQEPGLEHALGNPGFVRACLEEGPHYADPRPSPELCGPPAKAANSCHAPSQRIVQSFLDDVRRDDSRQVQQRASRRRYGNRIHGCDIDCGQPNDLMNCQVRLSDTTASRHTDLEDAHIDSGEAPQRRAGSMRDQGAFAGKETGSEECLSPGVLSPGQSVHPWVKLFPTFDRKAPTDGSSSGALADGVLA
jgi:hypothetical protein